MVPSAIVGVPPNDLVPASTLRPVQFRPEVERNAAIAYLGTTACALVVLSVVKPLLGAASPGHLGRVLHPQSGLLILTTALAILRFATTSSRGQPFRKRRV